MSQDNVVRLQCPDCKSFNYHTNRNLRRRDTHKLALMKFCRDCRKRTEHVEKAKD